MFEVIGLGFHDGQGDRMVTGAMDEGLVGWRWTEEVSGEREEILEGEGERVLERGKRGMKKMVGWVGKVVEELTSHIDWTCKRYV